MPLSKTMSKFVIKVLHDLYILFNSEIKHQIRNDELLKYLPVLPHGA